MASQVSPDLFSILMKLSKDKIFNSLLLFFTVLAVSVVPNFILWRTEEMPFVCGLANVLLPLGVYWTLMSLSAHVGRSVLWMIIVMFLAAFEIVLLDLYGNSVIGVDMWLNVVTSNSKEIGELLGNLIPVIMLVCLLYLPVIAGGIVAVVGKCRLDDAFLRRNRLIGIGLALCGALFMGAGMATADYVSPRYYLFPLNALDNARIAAVRYAKTSKYAETSGDFSYGARSTHDGDHREVYVLVVGETSRAADWQLMGYDRPTNATLAEHDGVVPFAKTLSESNTTHKSVPLLLSPLTARTFGDSIYSVKGLVTAFKEAGFRTVFLSNQERNGSFIDFFGEEADKSVFVKELQDDRYLQDEVLLDYLEEELEGDSGRLLVLLHTYGSHFNYHERYPAEFSRFTPDDATEAKRANRDMLLNAYDNSILYTSDLLARLISRLEKDGVTAAMLYTSDHGEDIYDDSRGLFLHASPRPSAYQLHVPYILWTSRGYAERYPDVVDAVAGNAGKRVSSSESFFHTALDLSGIRCRAFDPSCSVASKDYREPQWFYLNDHNEGVTLKESGLKDLDFEYLSRRGMVGEACM